MTPPDIHTFVARASRMLSPNVYVQLLSLTSGLLVAFLFPILFGLAEYGAFLQYVLPTLLIHRLIDSMSETLIPNLEGDEIFSASLLTGLITAAIGLTAFRLAGAPGPDPFLLVSMVATSSIILTCFRNELTWELVGLLALFCGTFVGLSVARLAGVNLSLLTVMLIPNVVEIVAGLGVLIARRVFIPRHGLPITPLSYGVRRMPLSLVSTLMVNVITVGFLWVAAPQMTAIAVAQLRVLSSVVQASVSLFPVSLKAIFVSFAARDGRLTIEKLLRGAFWFFLAGFAALQLLGMINMALRDLANVFLIAIPFYWAASMERHIQATGRRGLFRVINIVIAALSLAIAWFSASGGYAIYGYAAIIALYCVVLTLIYSPRGTVVVVSLLTLLITAATVGILLKVFAPWVGGLAVAAAGLGLMRPTRDLLRLYRGHV